MSGYTHSDLGLVRTFEAVASRRSFSEAAQHLGVSQSTVSEHVRLLEEKLGVKLLERTTRHVRLTGAGRDMWNYALLLLRVSVQIVNHFRVDHTDEAFRLGIAEDLAFSRFSRLVSLFADCFPGLQLSVRTGPTPHLVALLESESLDMVVGKRNQGGRGGRVLWINRTTWVAHKEAPSPVGPLPLLVICAPSILRSIALDALTQHRRSYRIVFEGNSFTALRAAFEISDGVTVALDNYLPEFLQSIANDGSLPPLPSVEVFAECRPDRLSPFARSLVVFIEDALLRLHLSDKPEKIR